MAAVNTRLRRTLIALPLAMAVTVPSTPSSATDPRTICFAGSGKPKIDIVMCTRALMPAKALTRATLLMRRARARIQLKDDARLAAVTCGEAGAIVVHRGEQTIVGTEAVSSVVDTTGAGDLFASGFLHGWTRDLPLDVCARMGNRCAGAIITQLGARPEASLKGLVADLV